MGDRFYMQQKRAAGVPTQMDKVHRKPTKSALVPEWSHKAGRMAGPVKRKGLVITFK